MIDGLPDWFKLSGAALADVCLMDDAEMLTFIKALCEMRDNAMNPDYHPEDIGGFVGRAIQREFDVFRQGVRSYMKLVNANPSGNPKGTQCLPNGYPMSTQTEQNRKDRRTEETVEQTRQELIRSGYSEWEIDNAIKTVKSWDGIRNRTGYIIGIIKKERNRPTKTVLAQQYEQRDYSGVQAELIAEQDREMEEYMKQEKEDGNQ